MRYTVPLAHLSWSNRKVKEYAVGSQRISGAGGDRRLPTDRRERAGAPPRPAQDIHPADAARSPEDRLDPPGGGADALASPPQAPGRPPAPTGGPPLAR